VILSGGEELRITGEKRSDLIPSEVTGVQDTLGET
jgi:hypothetical protein